MRWALVSLSGRPRNAASFPGVGAHHTSAIGQQSATAQVDAFQPVTPVRVIADNE